MDTEEKNAFIKSTEIISPQFKFCLTHKIDCSGIPLIYIS